MTHTRVSVLLATLLSISAAAVPAQGRSETPPSAAPVMQTETYQSAIVDSNGTLRITTSDNRQILVPKESDPTFGDQTTFGKVVLSANRMAVGAQRFYKNCCTSYDIPLEIVVYAQGRVHRFRGVELPIFVWNFADAGTRVAYSQEPVHFGCSIHYELRDIESEGLIDSAEEPELCAEVQNPPAIKLPAWVMKLKADFVR